MFCFICFLISFSFLFFPSWYRSDETPASLLLIWLRKKNWLNLLFKYDYFLGFVFLNYFSLPHVCFIIPFKPVPAILQEAIPATTQHVDSQLEVVQEQAYRYTAILEKVAKNPLMSQELQPYMLREALYNVRQCEIFLQVILVSYCLKSWPFPQNVASYMYMYTYIYIYTLALN